MIGVLVVALILFLLAAVAVVTGVLGLTGTLPPNRYFGVHTEDAIRTEDTYRVANRVAGPTSVGAGVLLAAAGAIALVAGVWVGVIATVVALVVALFTLGAGVNAANEAIADLVPAETGSCGSSCGSCSLRDACQPAN
ncbi:MAG: SdpI family protein [Stackebrandtia sp.]